MLSIMKTVKLMMNLFNPDRNSPDEIRKVIYLQPIGQFRQDQSPSIELLGEFAAAYFVMNGSNYLQESDSRPLSLCPVCLRKLQSSIGFDVAARYHRLQQFYSNVGFIFEQDWVTRRLEKIENSNYGQN
jgi:hypothetical protein